MASTAAGVSVTHSSALHDHGRQAPPPTSRYPSPQSRSSSPYTSTVLHHPNAGFPGISYAEEGTYWPSNALHSRPTIPANQHTVRRPETALHLTEMPKFVVPSSRIPRVEATTYSPPNSTTRVSFDDEDTAETKPKRRRANEAQLSLLNETYSRTMFPTTEERAEIARRINMTPRQVQIW